MDSAQKYFMESGFSPETVALLLDAGRRDMEKELSKLEHLKAQEPFLFEETDSVLHALKGLLMNTGNAVDAGKINDIRSMEAHDRHETVRLLNELLQ